MAPRVDLVEHFPGFGLLPPEVLRTLTASSTIVELSEGTRLFGPGLAPTSFLLILVGIVRVSQTSEGGREIVLYRATAGDTCALTSACLMGYEDYRADGIVEERVRAIAIPREIFDGLIASSREFRRFVFTAFSQRVTELFQIIEDVAFTRMETRIAQKLIQLADKEGKVAMTHQELANEVGSAREVITRLLGDFQRRGLIKLATRGVIEIIDGPNLSRVSEHG